MRDAASRGGADVLSALEEGRAATKEKYRVADVLDQVRTETRQILSKMLRERLVFVPETRNGKAGYRFHGEGSMLKLLSGVVPELSREAVASPTGTGLNYQPVFRGEFVIAKRAA